VAPSCTPKRPGERIKKTDRRDGIKLARVARAGELTAVYVPDENDEAMRVNPHPKLTLDRCLVQDTPLAYL
jgi:hypothetical protein